MFHEIKTISKRFLNLFSTVDKKKKKKKSKYNFKIKPPSVLSLLSILIGERAVGWWNRNCYFKQDSSIFLTFCSCFLCFIFLLICSLSGWAAEESSCHLCWGRLKSSWADCQFTGHCRWWIDWTTQAGGSWRHCLSALTVPQHHLPAFRTVCAPPAATVNLSLQL